MYVWLKEEKTVFLCSIFWLHFSFGKSTYLKTDWETTHLRHCVDLGWRLKVFSSLVFSLHQGTLSALCSRIQGYMLSLINEVDPCVASAVGFVWDAKLAFPTLTN